MSYPPFSFDIPFDIPFYQRVAPGGGGAYSVEGYAECGDGVATPMEAGLAGGYAPTDPPYAPTDPP